MNTTKIHIFLGNQGDHHNSLSRDPFSNQSHFMYWREFLTKHDPLNCSQNFMRCTLSWYTKYFINPLAIGSLIPMQLPRKEKSENYCGYVLEYHFAGICSVTAFEVLQRLDL